MKLHRTEYFCKYFGSNVVLQLHFYNFRDPKYGVEEGHGLKNEARKEKWIKKRQRPTAGQAWRKAQGLEPLVLGTKIKAMPEWSDVETGFPGAPTPAQIHAKKVNLQLCQDIFDAAMLVKRAQNIPK